MIINVYLYTTQNENKRLVVVLKLSPKWSSVRPWAILMASMRRHATGPVGNY
jgi:hypothetical protein